MTSTPQIYLFSIGAALRGSEALKSVLAQHESAAPDSLGLDPTTSAFVSAVSAAGNPTSHIEAREAFEALQSGSISKPPADIQDRILNIGPTGELPIRIYRPHGVQGPLPAVVYLHGGGWVLGSENTHDRLLRDMVNATASAGTPMAFVFVIYARSPEARYPVALEQAYAATKYIAEHGGDLNLDSSRLAVAGDSVGGGMATAVALLAKDRNGPQLHYQVLICPVTDARMNSGSYREFENGPFVTKASMAFFWDAYAPSEKDKEQVAVSPLLATTEQLKGLPPALVITDEIDILRDEGEEYARNLTASGVDVTAIRYLATVHDFVVFDALADTPITKSAVQLAAEALAFSLAK